MIVKVEVVELSAATPLLGESEIVELAATGTSAVPVIVKLAVVAPVMVAVTVFDPLLVGSVYVFCASPLAFEVLVADPRVPDPDVMAQFTVALGTRFA